MLEKEWLENLAEEVEELRQSLGDVDLGTLVSDPRTVSPAHAGALG
jgi:hypothetical protein